MNCILCVHVSCVQATVDGNVPRRWRTTRGLRSRCAVDRVVRRVYRAAHNNTDRSARGNQVAHGHTTHVLDDGMHGCTARRVDVHQTLRAHVVVRKRSTTASHPAVATAVARSAGALGARRLLAGDPARRAKSGTPVTGKPPEHRCSFQTPVTRIRHEEHCESDMSYMTETRSVPSDPQLALLFIASLSYPTCSPIPPRCPQSRAARRAARPRPRAPRRAASRRPGHTTGRRRARFLPNRHCRQAT